MCVFSQFVLAALALPGAVAPSVTKTAVFTSEKHSAQIAVEAAVPEDGYYEIDVSATDIDRGGDGVIVSLLAEDVVLGGRYLNAWRKETETVFLRPHLRRLRKGDRIQVSVDPRHSVVGDETSVVLNMRKSSVVAPGSHVIADRYCPVHFSRPELGGLVEDRIDRLIDMHYMKLDFESRWLKLFRERVEMPETNERPGWRYEGVGKLLDAGSLFSSYACDQEVATKTCGLFKSLLASMDKSGYIGFFKVRSDNAQQYRNWTFHEQEYLILGFARHYLCTGDKQALMAAQSLAGYFMRVFPTVANGLEKSHPSRLINTVGFPEAFLLLYGITGDRRYLSFAADTVYGSDKAEIRNDSVRKWSQPLDEWPNHVYSMICRTHAQMELYRIEGDPGLIMMMQRLRDALYGQDDGGAYITGSSSRAEHFTRNQDGTGNLEESCVTAYLLRYMDSLLRLEGDFTIGDGMERVIYNALFAAMSPDGSKIRYFTPFSGERRYDCHDGGFCCCGNFRRAMAELPQKIVYTSADKGLAVNLYVPFEKEFAFGKTRVGLKCETDYPTSGDVKFTVLSDAVAPMMFRIPRWSRAEASYSINGSPAKAAVPGQDGLLVLSRQWKEGDEIRLSFPMRWRLVRGRAMQRGRVSLMRGPMLFCIGGDQNGNSLACLGNPRNLWLDMSSLGVPEPDDSIRPGGIKVRAKFWPDLRRRNQTVDVVLTEFADPSGREIYFRVPDFMDDELFDREVGTR